MSYATHISISTLFVDQLMHTLNVCSLATDVCVSVACLSANLSESRTTVAAESLNKIGFQVLCWPIKPFSCREGNPWNYKIMSLLLHCLNVIASHLVPFSVWAVVLLYTDANQMVLLEDGRSEWQGGEKLMNGDMESNEWRLSGKDVRTLLVYVWAVRPIEFWIGQKHFVR